MKNKLKMYMAFSRAGGSEEGAVLVFAHNVPEAKKLAWPILYSWDYDLEWTDLAIRWLKEKDYSYLLEETDEEKFALNMGHAIESPKSCNRCLCWGGIIERDCCSLCKEAQDVCDDIDRICRNVADKLVDALQEQDEWLRTSYTDDDPFIRDDVTNFIKNATILPEMVQAMKDAIQYIGHDNPDRVNLNNRLYKLTHLNEK